MVKKWIGCHPGNFRAGRPPGLIPAAIVVHVMDGDLARTSALCNRPQSFVSAHYGIGRNGQVHQYVQEQDTAFHAGTVVNPTWKGIRKGVNPNFYTIGIEHEGQAQDLWPWPDAQLAASAALVAEIAARWEIPLDLEHVVAHRSIRASKACPGDNVVIQHILDRVPPAGPPGPAPVLPLAGVTQVQTLKYANLRLQQPSTSARIIRIIPANTVVKVAGFTDSGERVQDNSCWYQDTAGNYLWAGATDVPHPS